MTARTYKMQTQPDQRGFGLIEIMVAMLIGMLASIVIFQVFSVSERQKRTTTGSADAQTNAAFALYAIERDAKMAGFGLEADTLAGCKKIYSYFNDGSIESSVGAYTLPAAISLTNGAGNAPDTIQIVYYSNPADDNFVIPSGATLDSVLAAPGDDIIANSTSGCVKGRLALLQQVKEGEEYKCTVIQVTDINHGTRTIKHAAGAPPTYNPSVAYMTANAWPTYKKGDVLRCGVASSPTTRTYSLDSTVNELKSADSASGGGAQTIAANIVALQAQYGVADAGSLALNRADQWTDATGIWAKGTLAIGDGNGKRIKAIRVAVAARSSEYEKPQGSACTTTTSEMVDGWSTWANLSAVKNLPDWQCYRYKVVETVIPLRNVIWANTK